jgi:hypothetical protein
MNDTNTSQATLLRLIEQRIKDIDDGLTDADTAEILRLKAALDADRPTGDMVMQVIFNAFAFLHKDYHLKNDADFQVIMDFLQAFHGAIQQDFLSKVKTHKEGLAMELDSECF